MTSDPKKMPDDQRKRYEGCYCGLCRCLGRRCGQLSRCALAYDIAFLTLTLNSLYEPEEASETGVCPIHPFRRRESWHSEASDYGADLNVMLALLKAEDDWQDERRPVKRLEAQLLRRPAAEAAERNPRVWSDMTESMALLRDIELRRDPNPDAGSNAFGSLMASLFLWRSDRWSSVLTELGQNLGRFIYLLDAVADRKRDSRRGLYNPALLLQADGATEDDLRQILLMLMDSCAADWEKLPLVRDAELMRTILYSGVWSGLPIFQREHKGEHK